MDATANLPCVEVLLVEDNPGDVRLTREALKDDKVFIHLWVVGDGEEAISFLRRRGRHAGAPTPDVILLDLDLPRLNGREVLREVKADPTLQDIPVVVVTASREECDVGNVYSLPADAWVTKPVGFQQLATIVRSVANFAFTIVRLSTAGNG
jgi:chemotaxis family two-component system response regulator Rcp1